MSAFIIGGGGAFAEHLGSEARETTSPRPRGRPGGGRERILDVAHCGSRAGSSTSRTGEAHDVVVPPVSGEPLTVRVPMQSTACGVPATRRAWDRPSVRLTLFPSLEVNVQPGPRTSSIGPVWPVAPDRRRGFLDYLFAAGAPEERIAELLAFDVQVGAEDTAGLASYDRRPVKPLEVARSPVAADAPHMSRSRSDAGPARAARPPRGQWPYVLLATLAVAVLPVLVVSAVQALGVLHSTLAAVGVAAMLSVAISIAGSALWTRRPASRDLVFADLMLWGWIRRLRTERRLADARGLLGDRQGLSPSRQVQLLEQLSAALEARDPYTHGHSRRVTRYSEAIARGLGLGRKEVARIRTAAAVHDVGKIRTPREVLNKPGRLSDEEFAAIRRHPADGAEMVAEIGDAELTAMVRHHHERLDGRGYPDGLGAGDIPLGARIIAVADTFDAITSTRPYRAGSRHKTALDILRKEAGKQLDPAAVAAFLNYYSGRRSVGWWSVLVTEPPRFAYWLFGWLQGASATPVAKGVAAAGVAALIGASVASPQAGDAGVRGEGAAGQATVHRAGARAGAAEEPRRLVSEPRRAQRDELARGRPGGAPTRENSGSAAEGERRPGTRGVAGSRSSGAGGAPAGDGDSGSGGGGAAPDAASGGAGGGAGSGGGGGSGGPDLDSGGAGGGGTGSGPMTPPKIETPDVPKPPPVKVEVPEPPPVKVDVPEVAPVNVEVPQLPPVTVEVPELPPVKVEVPKLPAVNVEVPQLPSIGAG